MKKSTLITTLQKRPVYHVLFWLSYYLFILLFFYSVGHEGGAAFALQLFIRFIFKAALAYCNIYVFIPRLLLKKKYVLYVLSFVLLLLVDYVIETYLDKIYVALGASYYLAESKFSFRGLLANSLNQLYFLWLVAGVKFLKDWITGQQKMQQREKEYLKTELLLLKSQIQPHFFFNTLNNLYSLSLNKSDEAPEIILKMSDLMRYMLYESDTPQVSLNREIEHIENYIALEKLRFGTRLKFKFETKNITADILIPPMLLIVFIENSFKHGGKGNIDIISIDISLSVTGNFLSFTCTNSLAYKTTQDKEGIGLKLVKRRLDLLYGNNYTLTFSNDDETFKVLLKIPV